MPEKILKIITVDDSRLMIPYFEHIFRDLENVEWVGHAYSIEEAQQLIEKEKPNTAFLDICLKKGNGFRLLELIKKKYPLINVFMLSNTKDELYTKKSREMGALYLIDKTREFHLIPYFLQAVETAEKIGESISQFNPSDIDSSRE
ncbi:response regulator transcription factor [Antarcticibacterium flavum]|uniref:Response regulator transcription factor n=1 Tax=Antarcticibacterium flavum TaxID=2058175 RepID=A0A5B7WZ16_9FLAO|nr:MULTISPECIES: response regulator [Antarcticibacterium]MCM4161713.1 hypothetical protein [Antarcticibacterium sp. W02-3]QCY68359.1 response regulator transcription factor [Antarcticibacterium flavum]